MGRRSMGGRMAGDAAVWALRHAQRRRGRRRAQGHTRGLRSAPQEDFPRAQTRRRRSPTCRSQRDGCRALTSSKSKAHLKLGCGLELCVAAWITASIVALESGPPVGPPPACASSEARRASSSLIAVSSSDQRATAPRRTVRGDYARYPLICVQLGNGGGRGGV